MIQEIFGVFKHALVITGFVFVMMLVIEYINVQTKGVWQKYISGNPWKQYLLAALLGIIPGCLGAFTAVALFSHRLISFGAIVTAMIATSGDEAFVMLAMFPGKALLLTALLLITGILAGYLSDKIPRLKKIGDRFAENKFPLHAEESCQCYQKGLILKNLLKPSLRRIVLILLILILFIGVSTGFLAGKMEVWLRLTLLLAIALSLFIANSVPEHFLKEHLWDHIVKIHIPRIFLWTFGTLLVLHFLLNNFDIQTWFSDNMLIMLALAVLIGIIPESGPHLVFVTLFATGMLPFSILLASSIAQDGHGSLPLLAESKRSFLAVKFVNIAFAFVIGILAYSVGY